jgi:hypothetical protein
LVSGEWYVRTDSEFGVTILTVVQPDKRTLPVPQNRFTLLVIRGNLVPWVQGYMGTKTYIIQVQQMHPLLRLESRGSRVNKNNAVVVWSLDALNTNNISWLYISKLYPTRRTQIGCTRLYQTYCRNDSVIRLPPNERQSTDLRLPTEQHQETQNNRNEDNDTTQQHQGDKMMTMEEDDVDDRRR